MSESSCRWLSIVAAIAMCFGIAACSHNSRANVESAGDSGPALEGAGEGATPESGGEHATSQGRGEHAEPKLSGEHERTERSGEPEHGEHREGAEHEHGAEGEESGTYIGRDGTWDAARNGARLVLSFDPASNAFVGTVENSTGHMLCAVRVEVHLSSGTELGPTERTDIAPGAKTAVELPTGGEAFDGWTAHPEVSPCTGGAGGTA